MFILRQEQAIKSKEPVKQTSAGVTLAFRWSYIIIPMVVLLLSIILTTYFYQRLPVDVAYHFKSDGSPDRWLSRGAIILWTLLPQILLTLLAGAITWGIVKLSAVFRQLDSSRMKPGSILLVMGNMVALPQIVLLFAMLYIFSYNSYQIHILPLWVFALIVMAIGGAILSIFFVRVMRHVRSQ
ncbi:DUF1648 domain-containing protein [Chloroflexota bacterium]